MCEEEIYGSKRRKKGKTTRFCAFETLSYWLGKMEAITMTTAASEKMSVQVDVLAAAPANRHLYMS